MYFYHHFTFTQYCNEVIQTMIKQCTLLNTVALLKANDDHMLIIYDLLSLLYNYIVLLQKSGSCSCTISSDVIMW